MCIRDSYGDTCSPEGGAMNGIKIRGTGHAAPSKIVTNDDLAKIVETNDEWITSRTGISRRHHLAEGETVTACLLYTSCRCAAGQPLQRPP